MSGSDVMAVCDLGHEFLLKDFEPVEEVIAAISWCPEMVSKATHSGLVLECGAKVLWLRHLPRLDKVKKVFKLPKDRQLDLFIDYGEEKLPLDKVNE